MEYDSKSFFSLRARHCITSNAPPRNHSFFTIQIFGCSCGWLLATSWWLFSPPRCSRCCSRLPFWRSRKFCSARKSKVRFFHTPADFLTKLLFFSGRGQGNGAERRVRLPEPAGDSAAPRALWARRRRQVRRFEQWQPPSVQRRAPSRVMPEWPKLWITLHLIRIVL